MSVSMKRGLKKLLKTCAYVAGGAVLLIAAAVIIVVFDKPLVKKAVQSLVAKKTGLALTIGRLDYRLFPLSVEASSLKVSYATPVYSLEINAGRAGLKGDFMKLLRGDMPALETIDADIAEIRINQVKISPEAIDLQALNLQIAKVLNYSRQATLRCSRTVALLLSQDFRLDNTSLTIIRGRAGGAFDVSLSCENIAGAMSRGMTSFGSGLKADGELNLGRTTGFNLRLALAKPRIDVAGKAAAVDELNIYLQGAWQPDKMFFQVPNLAVDVPGLASLNGNLNLGAGEIPSFEAGVKASLTDLESLGLAADPFLPAALRSVRLRGKADLEAKYALSPGPKGRPAALSARLETPGIAWEYKNRDLPLHGKLSGTLEAKGPPADPRLSGDVRLESGSLSGMGASAQNAWARLRFAGSKSAAKIAVASAALNGVTISVSGRPTFVFDKIDVSGNAAVRLDGDPSVAADLETRFPGFAPIRLTGRFGPAPWRLNHASLESAGQQISALRGLLAAFLPPEIAPWDAGGTVAVSLKVDGAGHSKGQLGLQADIALSGGKFNDPNFTVASDGLRAQMRLQGDYRPASRELGGTATIEFLQGESLWKHFYISWDKSPLKAEISGRYAPPARTLEGLSAKVTVSGLGELRAAGRLGLAAPLAFSLQTSSQFALEPAVGLLSEAGSSRQGRAQVGGQVSSEFVIIKTGTGLSLKGELKLGDVSLVSPSSGFSIPGLSAELPLDLAFGAPPAPAPAEARGATGTVRIGEIRTSRLTFQVPPLIITSLTNAYEIAPFAIDFFGGRLEVGKTSLAVKSGPFPLQGASSLKLSEIDLSRLPFLLPGSPPAGKARADFPDLEITLSMVRASGQAEADIFGGQVIVTDLAVADPFAADRRISCDIGIRDFDLKKITDLVPFGEVTGFIRGEVRDLVIAYGQPERFTLTLESVKRKGVARTFSLRAVNSLTVIASGQRTAPGTGSFWLRFIKGFRYDKIGIRSTLRNDTFTIEGTIKDSGVEYLVKRPPLFGISVINRDPGKTIGFKEMMSRLRRVGQSGAPDVK
ncbi:MAG: hypothetical protein A2W03_09640 [Candidatus Aminicenantes bacterium RBG_16_63_16]|nr:MAG: hypothetical protein A2W03_09640 [Candidatus Aminicenantes bacterium RBG_16_63_16]